MNGRASRRTHRASFTLLRKSGLPLHADGEKGDGMAAPLAAFGAVPLGLFR